MEKAENLMNFKYEPVKMSEEDRLAEIVEFENNQPGNYNLDDGYNCELCKNKGYIAKLEKEPFLRIVNEKCSCMNIRKSIKSLKNSGLSVEMLMSAKFSNFETTKDWQKLMFDLAKKYVLNFDKSKWFYIGGTTGAGKTMLMTAVFKEIIKRHHLVGYYLLWNAESKSLITNSKRNVEKYNERMYELTNCDILYIDDFLKLDNVYSNDELSLAYEIINNRYVSNKITLITSELGKNQLALKDNAIFGRIVQKCGIHDYMLELTGEDKNYRTKELRGE